MNEQLGIYEHRAGESEGKRSHTRSFSSVSRLREAANASETSGASGGGVGLLKLERRGELREAETRGLTADRAVAPLVIELECIEGGLRRGGGFWSADDILWVTLGTLCAYPPSASVARHVHVYRPSHHDSIRITRSSKISFITCNPLTHLTCSY